MPNMGMERDARRLALLMPNVRLPEGTAITGVELSDLGRNSGLVRTNTTVCIPQSAGVRFSAASICRYTRVNVSP